MLSVRRLVAGSTVLLLAFAAAAPAVAACAGWSISLRDRHACCAHLGQLAADSAVADCCAMAEQSGGPGERESQLSVAGRPVALTAAVLVPSPEFSVLAAPGRVPVEASSPPKYVLLGSFLI